MSKLTVKKSGKATLLAALMATCISPMAANADNVTLRSADGSIDLFGKLLEYTDEFYVLETSLGNLRIGSARVRCEGAACPTFETATADVQITGSQAIGTGLMPLLMEGYAGHRDAESAVASTSLQGQILASLTAEQGFGDEMGSFLVTSTDSAAGLKSLLDNEAQIAMSSRRILPQEARDLKAAGAGNMISPSQEHIVAVDSIVVIVNPQNPVQSLSMAQVSDIYSGKITNWSEVGGPNLAIEVVSREEGATSRNVFDTAVRGDADAAQPGNVLIATDHTQAASYVTKNVAAIGYVGFAFQRGAKAIPLVNECNIAMVPDAFSAKTEEYALQRRMYLYVRGDGLDQTSQEFLSYATSENADSVILKSGFIDLGITSKGQAADSSRAIGLQTANLGDFEAELASQMLTEMPSYERLSTTFRFRTGSAKLDERGRLDMERLAAFLSRQPADSSVMLVGFTDDVGAFGANHQLSINRATQVAEQLRQVLPAELANLNIQSTGYGEIAPTACNVSDAGRGINRRVEVWIKSKA